jgi:hypothetical protein
METTLGNLSASDPNLKILLPRVGSILLFLVVIEILLGGNGYLIHIAGLRLRELFFILTMGWVAVALAVFGVSTVPKGVYALLAAFLFLTGFGTVWGFYNGSTGTAILAELKPLGYFPMILFFVMTVKTMRDIRMLAWLFVACGVLQSIIYLALLGAVYAHVIEYTWVYETLHQSDEFIFRHNPAYGPFIGFFYKGGFHIGIGAIFLLLNPKGIKIFLSIITVGALAMMLTRGLMLALIISVVCGLVLIADWRRFLKILPFLVFGVLTISTAISTEANLLQLADCLTTSAPDEECLKIRQAVLSQDLSKIITKNLALKSGLVRSTDKQRVGDILAIFDDMHMQTLLLGHGIGAKINGRTRIEMTYLEIMYKQGLAGLLFWGLIPLYIFLQFRRVPKSGQLVAVNFLCAAMYVYVATSTNTFLTGSIGLPIVFLGLSCMLVLQRIKPGEEADCFNFSGGSLLRFPAGKEAL